MIRKLYRRLWLKLNGYCRHGNKWRFMPPGYYHLGCPACADPAAWKRVEKNAKAKAYARSVNA